jgi:hypothetical protein
MKQPRAIFGKTGDSIAAAQGANQLAALIVQPCVAVAVLSFDTELNVFVIEPLA